MALLGILGRFGNQVFQYAFLRLCASASGTSVQCSRWIGRDLFGHHDPPVTVGLRPLIDSGTNMQVLAEVLPEFIPFTERLYGPSAGTVPRDALANGCKPGELIGLFQWHSSEFLPYRETFRSFFQPCEDLEDWLNEPIRRMRERGKTIVAIHLRTGDYKWLPQYSWTLVVPPQKWVEWLDTIWDTLDEPVLYVCSNDVAAVRSRFARFNPVTSEDLSIEPPPRLRGLGAGFYLDYHVMTQADVLGASNSSFSFSAAMLNERARLFFRPGWKNGLEFIEFDPWNADVLLRVSSGRRQSRKSYPVMLQIARETSGISGAIATALWYHPVGAAATIGTRLKLASMRRWWQIRSALLRRR